jgi:hypothetical protein
MPIVHFNVKTMHDSSSLVLLAPLLITEGTNLRNWCSITSNSNAINGYTGNHHISLIVRSINYCVSRKQKKKDLHH